MKKSVLMISVILLLAACNAPSQIVAPEAELTPTGSPTDTAASDPPTEQADIDVPEAIMILAPGPGSFLTSPMRLVGMADPTHEQSLILRGLRLDGSLLIAPQPITISAALGSRGPFEVEVPFDVSQEERVFLQVYAQSARDGGITHLASVAVTLSPDGPEEILTASRSAEQIVIQAPSPGSLLSGGRARVEGIGVASFEGTFVIELVDENGTVIASQPVISEAPDMGLPGTFSADLTFNVSQTGPGRIVVRDPSPAFGGDVHLASVEVRLEP